MNFSKFFLYVLGTLTIYIIIFSLPILISSCGEKDEIPSPIIVKNAKSIISKTFKATQTGDDLTKDKQIGGYSLEMVNGDIKYSDFSVLDDTSFNNSIFNILPSGYVNIKYKKQFPKEAIYDNDKYIANTLRIQPFNPNKKNGTTYQYIRDFKGRYLQQNNYNSNGSKIDVIIKEYNDYGNVLKSVTYHVGLSDTLKGTYMYNTENKLRKSTFFINGILSTFNEYEYKANTSIRRHFDSGGNLIDLDFVTTYSDSIKTMHYLIKNGDTVLNYYNTDYFDNSDNELVTSYYFHLINGFTQEGNKEYDEYGNRILDEQKVVYQDGRVYYNTYSDENIYYENQLIKSKTSIYFENSKQISVRYNDIGIWDASHSNYKIYGYDFDDEPILFREYFVNDSDLKNLQIFYDSIGSINEIIWFISKLDGYDLYEPYLHLDSRIKDISLIPESNVIINYPSRSFINEYIDVQSDFIQKSYNDDHSYSYTYLLNDLNKPLNIDIKDILTPNTQFIASFSYDGFGNLTSEVIKVNNQVVSDIKYEYDLGIRPSNPIFDDR
jgi:hypothetical protein